MSDPTLETSSFLLRTLKSDNQSLSWFEFQELYEPLIRRWLNRSGLQIQDIDDLTQNVLTVVVRRLDEFDHQKRTGCFRAWLKMICANCLREFWRVKNVEHKKGLGKFCKEVIEQMEDENSELSKQWNVEHDHHVVNKLLKKVQPNFSQRTFDAFVETFLKGRETKAVAEEYKVSENAITIARSRVLTSLKEICEGMVDLDEFE